MFAQLKSSMNLVNPSWQEVHSNGGYEQEVQGVTVRCTPYASVVLGFGGVNKSYARSAYLPLQGRADGVVSAYIDFGGAAFVEVQYPRGTHSYSMKEYEKRYLHSGSVLNPKCLQRLWVR